MADLDVQHYLGVYKIRLKLFEDGITNPTEKGKIIIQTIVDKLSKLPLDEKIILDDYVMKDIRGNIIVDFLK